ncbi:MAG: hypothetical protein MK101_09615 [Phycisphaerales bacterium]|nr:hypothetical protein [Phycisphaerales bacterium]
MSGPTAGGWSLDGLVMLAVLVALACVWLGAPVLGIGAGIAVLLLPLGERVFRDPPAFLPHQIAGAGGPQGVPFALQSRGCQSSRIARQGHGAPGVRQAQPHTHPA